MGVCNVLSEVLKKLLSYNHTIYKCRDPLHAVWMFDQKLVAKLSLQTQHTFE